MSDLKRIILTLIFGALLIFVGWLTWTITSSQAATKTLTFNWQQDAASLPTLQMWRIYSSTTAGGPYSLMSQIVYDGQAKPEYVGTSTITQGDNTSKTYYFIARAVGKNGNESGNSNEVSAVIDLTAPSVPVQFRVTISN